MEKQSSLSQKVQLDVLLLTCVAVGCICSNCHAAMQCHQSWGLWLHAQQRAADWAAVHQPAHQQHGICPQQRA